MTDSNEATRRKRRAHAIAAVGLAAAGGPYRVDDVMVRAIAAMLAEVEENLCRKIGAKR